MLKPGQKVRYNESRCKPPLLHKAGQEARVVGKAPNRKYQECLEYHICFEDGKRHYRACEHELEPMKEGGAL